MRYTTERLNELKAIEELATTATFETFNSGGFTHWYDGVERTTGYVVGNNSDPFTAFGEDGKDGESLSFGDLREAVLTALDEVGHYYDDDDNDCHYDGFGTWLNAEGEEREGFGGRTYQATDLVYIDNITHVEDLGDALKLARKNGELAIYDIANQCCIDTTKPHHTDYTKAELQNLWCEAEFCIETADFYYSLWDDTN